MTAKTLNAFTNALRTRSFIVVNGVIFPQLLYDFV